MFTISTFDHGVYYVSGQNFQPQIKRFLTTKSVYAILEDQGGIFYAATHENGVFSLNPSTHPNVTETALLINELPSTTAFSLWLDHSKHLWIGTDGGITKYNILSKQFGFHAPTQKDATTLNRDNISDVVEGPNNTLWIATFEGGLIRYDTKTNNFLYHVHLAGQNTIIDNHIRALAIGPDGLWIGTKNGLDYLSFASGIFEHFLPVSSGGLIADNDVHALLIDKQNTLWLGTYEHGLQVKFSGDEQFTNFSYNPNNLKSISSNAILGFYESRLGELWVFTEHGLNKYDSHNQEFIRFYPAKSNQFISTIWEDDQHYLWIGTYEGIFIIDSDGLLIKALDTSHRAKQ